MSKKKSINKKREDLYYDIMCHFRNNTDLSYNTIKPQWYYCFRYTLRKWGFTNKTIKDLFYHFDMDNWAALHKENTEYKDSSTDDLKDSFFGECYYSCDRMSYDRLFRAHWLFRQVYRDELMRDMYPALYGDDEK